MRYDGDDAEKLDDISHHIPQMVDVKRGQSYHRLSLQVENSSVLCVVVVHVDRILCVHILRGVRRLSSHVVRREGQQLFYYRNCQIDGGKNDDERKDLR